MARGPGKQKTHLISVIHELLEDAVNPGGKLEGANLVVEDSSTMLLEVPSAWGGTKFALTIRERML